MVLKVRTVRRRATRRLPGVTEGRRPGKAVEAFEATTLAQASVTHSDAPDVAGARSVDIGSKALMGLGVLLRLLPFNEARVVGPHDSF